MEAKSFEATLEVIQEARKALYEATETEIQVREILRGRESELLAIGKDGPISGGNAEVRTAQLREATGPERAALAKAEHEKRFAALELELALDARRCIEYCIRLEEISQ
jgi:hypothetical protein